MNTLIDEPKIGQLSKKDVVSSLNSLSMPRFGKRTLKKSKSDEIHHQINELKGKDNLSA